MSRHLYWEPAGTLHRRVSTRELPAAGQVIGWVSDRRAYRVEAVREIHQANWSQDTRQMWERAGRPPWQEWPDREWAVHLEPARPKTGEPYKVTARRLCPWRRTRLQWHPLYDPWPECVECGCLWPCPCKDEHDDAAAAMAELETLAAILPGCCWACYQPITARSHSIVFEGENLLLPGAPPAVFHTSGSRKSEQYGQTCRGEAIKYEKKWAAAAEGRTLQLSCPGTLFRHFDGYECDLGPLCPGPAANHADALHCSTHGMYREFSDRPLTPSRNCGNKGCRGPT